MNLDPKILKTAWLAAQGNLSGQKLTVERKNRWLRAFEKSKVRLLEHPFFSWQPEKLIIISVPPLKTPEIGCRFYEANDDACRRLDRTGLCQAYYEGYPCWHRAAFLLLKLYFSHNNCKKCQPS